MLLFIRNSAVPEKYYIHDFDSLVIFRQVCATLGTTGACAFDNLDEVGFESAFATNLKN